MIYYDDCAKLIYQCNMCNEQTNQLGIRTPNELLGFFKGIQWVNILADSL